MQHGIAEGVERITKVMMSCLFLIMIVLCVRSVTLDGAAEGLKFYLVPDFGKMFENGWSSFGEAVYAAMGQSFFTLSLGISAMAIFGSYIGKDRALTGEALNIGILDTIVALMAGLIIFPACFVFNVNRARGQDWYLLPAKRLWADVGRSSVGDAVLPVYEFCGVIHDHCCV